MKEKDIWQKIRDDQRNFNVFMQRIESHSTAEGIPDLYFRNRGFAGWCELKYLHPTASNKYNLSLDKYPIHQRDWNAIYTRHGGNCLLCVGIGGKIFWLSGKKAVTILKFTLEEIKEWAFHQGAMFPDEMPGAYKETD